MTLTKDFEELKHFFKKNMETHSNLIRQAEASGKIPTQYDIMMKKYYTGGFDALHMLENS